MRFDELAQVFLTKLEIVRAWQSRGVRGAIVVAIWLGTSRHPGTRVVGGVETMRTTGAAAAGKCHLVWP
jgi:hypothetical protein